MQVINRRMPLLVISRTAKNIPMNTYQCNNNTIDLQCVLACFFSTSTVGILLPSAQVPASWGIDLSCCLVCVSSASMETSVLAEAGNMYPGHAPSEFDSLVKTKFTNSGLDDALGKALMGFNEFVSLNKDKPKKVVVMGCEYHFKGLFQFVFPN